jgi:nitrite reductase/ring-hydroxylating ferredoxin subunit/uncharacterized membrane protein
MRSPASIKSLPLHPALVVFPIALWITSFLFALLAIGLNSSALRAAGFYCVIAGCVGAVLAAIPGAWDWFTIVPSRSSAKSRGLLHGSLNVLALILYIWVAARLGDAGTKPDRVTLSLMGIGVVILVVSGWLGGTLVFRNQIGVDRYYAGAGKLKTRSLDTWERPVCHQSELGDGQMLLAIIGDERVVIGRCSQGLFAFSDHCTHRGGPLSDGALVNCVVQCPWHGSQFDIVTGRVVSGPSAGKIQTYQVEIRAGEVFVQAPPAMLKPVEPPQAA